MLSLNKTYLKLTDDGDGDDDINVGESRVPNSR